MLRVPRWKNCPNTLNLIRGDTIVTSGYSAIFPPGLIVGTIEEFYNGRDDNFYSLKIRLATSFQTLQHVRVIRNFRQEEQINLEKEAKKMINNILRSILYFVVFVMFRYCFSIIYITCGLLHLFCICIVSLKCR